MREEKSAITKSSAGYALRQNGYDFSEHDIDSIKLYCDFMYKSLIETTNLIKQGAIYYFIIVAATNSFLLASPSSNIDRSLVSNITILISIFFSIIMFSVAWGVLTGLAQLSKSYQTLNREMYIQLKIGSYFKKGIGVGVIIVVMCIAILFVLVAGFYFQR